MMSLESQSTGGSSLLAFRRRISRSYPNKQNANRERCVAIAINLLLQTRRGGVITFHGDKILCINTKRNLGSEGVLPGIDISFPCCYSTLGGRVALKLQLRRSHSACVTPMPSLFETMGCERCRFESPRNSN